VSELPKGWVHACLPELISRDGVFLDGDWVESKDQDQDGDVRLIQLADIGDGRYVDKSNRFLTQSKAIALGCTFLHRGDVLIARMPDPLGRACIFPGDKKHAVTVVDVCVVRGKQEHFDRSWLMHFINSAPFRADIYSLQSGSTRKRISRGNLSTLKLPVPPRAEQTRIVEKLEELLSQLDAGVAELKAAQKKLAQYRQSLLKAAVEGALTAEWRTQHTPLENGAQLLARILTERRARWEAKQLAKFAEQGKTPPKDWQKKYPEPVQPDTTDLPELPEGWVWASVDQCSLDESAITDGPFGSNLKSSHYQETGPRVIRLQNIGDGVFIDAKAHISQDHYEQLAKHAVEKDDLVVAMLGEVLPRACTIPSGVSPAIVKADCARVRLNKTLAITHVVMSQLNSKPVRDAVLKFVKGIGRPRVNLGHIRAIPLAICSMEEQREIERSLADAETSIEYQLSAIDLSLKQSAAQRQNILRAAFAGQLVPQDPNDEPASVLLKRIRAERAERQKQPKVRKTRQQKEIAAVVSKLINVLAEAGDWVPAQEAFQRCGVADGAETDQVEALYAELRALDKGGRLEVEAVTDTQGRKLHDRLKLRAG
jgi:type I restriction enzyme S subunit